MGDYKCKVTYTDDKGEKHDVYCYGDLQEDSNVLIVYGEDGEEIYADGVESSWTKTVRKIAKEMYGDGKYFEEDAPLHEVTSC